MTKPRWTNPALASFDRAIGAWSVVGAHPMLPGRALRGRVVFERVDDGAFIRMRSTMDDDDIPDGVALFGTDDDGGCTMLYFDARGVSRTYDVALHDDGFAWSRNRCPKPPTAAR
jgi:hypothetical protein